MSASRVAEKAALLDERTELALEAAIALIFISEPDANKVDAQSWNGQAKAYAAVLGKTSMPVNQLLRLGRGAVVELDRKVGEPIDIYVNNRLVARGEVLIVDDHLGITMTEIIKSDS